MVVFRGLTGAKPFHGIVPSTLVLLAPVVESKISITPDLPDAGALYSAKQIVRQKQNKTLASVVRETEHKFCTRMQRNVTLTTTTAEVEVTDVMDEMVGLPR